MPERNSVPERVHDATRVAPYLTHVVRHHGQLTLIPPDNAGRVRKEERERKRRTPRADPSTSAVRIEPTVSGSSTRRDRTPRPASQISVRHEDRASMAIPDYPPPSFEEAISAGARSPYSASAATSMLSLTTAPSSRAPSPPPLLPPARSHNQPRLTLHSPVRENDPRTSMQVHTSDAESDHDSEPEPEVDGAGSESSGEMIEVAEVGASTSQWEQDRLAGYSLKQRMERERARQLLAEPPPTASSAPRRSRSRLNLLLAASPSKLNLLSPSSSQLNLSMSSSSSRREGLSPTSSFASAPSPRAQRPTPLPRSSSPPPRSARVASRSPTRTERATSRSPTRADRSPREVRFDTDVDGDIVGDGSPVRTAFPRRGRGHTFNASSTSLVSPFPSPESQLPPGAQTVTSSEADATVDSRTANPLRSLFSASQLSLPLHFLSAKSNDPESSGPSVSNSGSNKPSRPTSTPGGASTSFRSSRNTSPSPTRVDRATSRSPTRADWSPEDDRFDTDVDGDIVGSGSPVRTAFPRRGLMHLLPGFTNSSASLVSPFPSPESQLSPPAQVAAGNGSSDAPAVAQTSTPPRASFSTSQLSLPLHILSRPGSPPRRSWRRGSIDSPTAATSPSPLSFATYPPPSKDKDKDSLESWELLDASMSDVEAFQSVDISNPPSPVVGSSVSNPFRRRKPPPPPSTKAKPRPPPITTKPRLSLKGKERAAIEGDAPMSATTASSLKGKLGMSPSAIWSRRRTMQGPASPTATGSSLDESLGAESPTTATTPTTCGFGSPRTAESDIHVNDAPGNLSASAQTAAGAPASPITPTTPTNSSVSLLPPRLSSASASASSSSSASSGLIPVSASVSSSQSLASASPSSPTAPATGQDDTPSMSAPSSPISSSTPTPAQSPFIKRAVHAPLSRSSSPLVDPALSALAAERTPSPPPPQAIQPSSGASTKGKEREAGHDAPKPALSGSSALRERLGMNSSTVWGRRHTVPSPGSTKPTTAGAVSVEAKPSSTSTVAPASSTSAVDAPATSVAAAPPTSTSITSSTTSTPIASSRPASPSVAVSTAAISESSPSPSLVPVTPPALQSTPTLSTPPSTTDTPTSAYELFAAKSLNTSSRRPTPPSASAAIQALAAKRAPPPPPPPRPSQSQRKPPPVPPRLSPGYSAASSRSGQGHARTHSAPTPFDGVHALPASHSQPEAESPSSPISLHAPPSPSHPTPPVRSYAPVRPSPLAQPPVPAASPPASISETPTPIIRVPVPPRSDSSSATIRAPAAPASPAWTPLRSPVSPTDSEADYATAHEIDMDGGGSAGDSGGMEMERTESLLDLYDHSPEASSADDYTGSLSADVDLPRLPEDLPPLDAPLPAPLARAGAWASILPSMPPSSSEFSPSISSAVREEHQRSAGRPLPLPPGGGSRQPMVPPPPFSRPTTPREAFSATPVTVPPPRTEPRARPPLSSARVAPSSSSARGPYPSSTPQIAPSSSSSSVHLVQRPLTRPSTPSSTQHVVPPTSINRPAPTVITAQGLRNQSSAAGVPVSASAAGTPDLSELDILLSRLDTADGRAGENYEDLLRVADILGPARPARHPRAATMQARRGDVVCTRRRVTKDGRTKLKLELLGLSVDKCGICLAQMRDGEAGARAEDCKHAFHEKCLRRWLAQRGTCPNCREPLQMEEQ